MAALIESVSGGRKSGPWARGLAYNLQAETDVAVLGDTVQHHWLTAVDGCPNGLVEGSKSEGRATALAPLGPVIKPSVSHFTSTPRKSTVLSLTIQPQVSVKLEERDIVAHANCTRPISPVHLEHLSVTIPPLIKVQQPASAGGGATPPGVAA